MTAFCRFRVGFEGLLQPFRHGYDDGFPVLPHDDVPFTLVRPPRLLGTILRPRAFSGVSDEMGDRYSRYSVRWTVLDPSYCPFRIQEKEFSRLVLVLFGAVPGRASGA